VEPNEPTSCVTGGSALRKNKGHVEPKGTTSSKRPVITQKQKRRYLIEPSPYKDTANLWQEQGNIEHGDDYIYYDDGSNEEPCSISMAFITASTPVSPASAYSADEHHRHPHQHDYNNVAAKRTNTAAIIDTVRLLPLLQPPVRARTDARTNPSAQRATQLRIVLARVYAVSIQNQITTTVP
jgi:hypothetical protein